MWAGEIAQTPLFVDNFRKNCWFRNHASINSLISHFLFSRNAKSSLSSY